MITQHAVACALSHRLAVSAAAYSAAPYTAAAAAASISGRDGGAVDCVAAAQRAFAGVPSKQRAWEQLCAVNATQPGLVGQDILAQVVLSKPDALLVDPGYYGLCQLQRKALGTAEAYDAAGRPVTAALPLPLQRSADGDASGAAAGQALRPRPGEYVRLRVSSLFTPYGDMQLDPVRMAPAARRKLVWEALHDCMNKGTRVRGRVLNVCQGGYAVGVAGYVALLPFGQAGAEELASIGTLREFWIHAMDPSRKLITLTFRNPKVRSDLRSLYSNVV